MKIEITLDDRLAERLQSAASQAGLTVELLIAEMIQHSTARPRQWMPRQKWEALVRGEDCPLCRAVAAKEAADLYGHTIADLHLSRLRLVANQYIPGYCVLLCSEHVVEPYDLSKEKRALFWEDMLSAAQAIAQVFQPVKMNFQILGNEIPHLHSHIVPRYYGDRAPGRPIDPGERTVLLTTAEYAERVRLMRAALAGQSATRR